MNILKIVLAIVLIPVSLFSRPNKEKTGSSCRYEYTHSPAVVEFVLPGMFNSSDIFFIVHTNYGTDTMTYSSVNHGPLSNDTIRKYNIKRGDVFTYTEGNIVEGSCSPRTEQFQLKKYVPDYKVNENQSSCPSSKVFSGARILSINPIDSVNMDMTFCIYGMYSLDTVTYFQINQSYITNAEINTNGFKKGDDLTYVEEFGLQKGCAVFYTASILLEKYIRPRRQ
ncbi:hypothetical protein BH09BAC5_BH09BAC5_16820 [soil metagenome]